MQATNWYVILRGGTFDTQRILAGQSSLFPEVFAGPLTRKLAEEKAKAMRAETFKAGERK